MRLVVLRVLAVAVLVAFEVLAVFEILAGVWNWKKNLINKSTKKTVVWILIGKLFSLLDLKYRKGYSLKGKYKSCNEHSAMNLELDVETILKYCYRCKNIIRMLFCNSQNHKSKANNLGENWKSNSVSESHLKVLVEFASIFTWWMTKSLVCSFSMQK